MSQGYRFAFVEDEDAVAKQLYGYLAQFARDNDYSVSAVHFRSGESFLNRKEGFDAVFMDISLPGMDGLSCAKTLRERDEKVIIVFVTSLAQLAIRGYEVSALDFIVKPVLLSDFRLKLKRVFHVLNSRKPTRLLIEGPSGNFQVQLDDLLYVEVSGHTLFYHLRHETIKQGGSLKNAEQTLLPHGFLRCSRYCLVNPAVIRKVSGDTVWIGEESLTISRPQKKQFLEAFSEYVSKADH